MCGFRLRFHWNLFLINYIPAFVQIMPCCRPGDKPSFELMMLILPTHIYVTQPQWVNPLLNTICVICMTRYALKRKLRHFDEISATDCTGSCHFDNFRFSQWRKFIKITYTFQYGITRPQRVNLSVFILTCPTLDDFRCSFHTIFTLFVLIYSVICLCLWYRLKFMLITSNNRHHWGFLGFLYWFCNLLKY